MPDSLGPDLEVALNLYLMLQCVCEHSILFLGIELTLRVKIDKTTGTGKIAHFFSCYIMVSPVGRFRLHVLWPLGLALLMLTALTMYVASNGQIQVLSRSHLLWMSGSTADSARQLALGPYPRTIMPPQNSSPDAGLPFSLLDEAQHLTTVSPYLRVSSDGVNVELYGISMYHQLHCLQSLREAITKNGDHQHSEHKRREAGREEHLVHCIDYISQVSAYVQSRLS